MRMDNSPLESLAAFSIVFVAGIVSTVSFFKYIEKIKRDLRREEHRRHLFFKRMTGRQDHPYSNIRDIST